MITPKFSCSQDEKSVTTKCYMPSIRAQEVDIDVDGQILTLHVNPYFLRLTFPHRVIEDDESSARYDPSDGYLTIILTKEEPGQVFEDLDLLARLLAPSTAAGSGIRVPPNPFSPATLDMSSQIVEEEHEGTNAMAALSLDSSPEQSKRTEPFRPLIEVISSVSADRPDESSFKPSAELLKEREIFLEAAKNDWRLPQSDPSSDSSPSISLSTQATYGFLNAYSGYFRHASQSSPNEVNNLGDLAETASEAVRDEVRRKREEEKFDEQYYMADFVNDEEINEHIAWKSPFADHGSKIEFNEEENATMLKLPRKEYIPTPLETQSLYLTLLTILFSYSYDTRTTQHDPTPESAWTIAILTPAMSSLSPPHPSSSPLNALVSSYRRALAFPLYRSYTLCEALRKDVADILCGGRRAVTRALLETKNILDGHDVYYVYGKIWVDDFLVWIMASSSDEALVSLGESVRRLEMPKSTIGWPLEELEEAAMTVEDE